MSKPPKAVIVWEDCYVLDSETWVKKHEGAFEWKPYLVETMGFVLYDGAEGVVVTDSWTDAEHTGTRTQIPRGMIRSITYEKPLGRKRVR